MAQYYLNNSVFLGPVPRPHASPQPVLFMSRWSHYLPQSCFVFFLIFFLSLPAFVKMFFGHFLLRFDGESVSQVVDMKDIIEVLVRQIVTEIFGVLEADLLRVFI